jgi:hypothetical protein
MKTAFIILISIWIIAIIIFLIKSICIHLNKIEDDYDEYFNDDNPNIK